MNINKRIKLIIKWLIGNGVGNNQADIGKLLGYTNKSSFSQVLNGKVPLPGDFIDRLCSLDKNINKVWIEKGIGEMIIYPVKDENVIERSKINIVNEMSLPPYNFTNKNIPLIPIDAMAGYLKGEFQIMEYDCEQYVIPIFRDAEFLIQVKGSSMYPKYNSGDIVACKKLPLNDIFFQWNKVYVIDTIQGALVKRVKKGSDDDHILLLSENEKYDPFELPKSQINAIALVVGVIRLE